MIKACIFDLDGTLADSVESLAYAGNSALRAHGFKPAETERFNYYAGDGVKVLVERMLKEAGDEKLTCYDKVLETYLGVFQGDCTYKVKTFDGMRGALNSLKEQGVKLAVLSNKPHHQTEEVTEALYGQGFFDIILGQKDDMPRKPDPAGALMIQKELGVTGDECLYVGDTNVDMETGKNGGMHTIGVLWGFRDYDELLAGGAEKIISHPSELVETAKQF